MNKEQLKIAIGKLINVIKPTNVSNISISLDPIDIKNTEYYMHITYVVPDDSEFLKMKNKPQTDFYRDRWNREVKDNIKNYLNAKVIINSSSITSESYYERLKEYENG
jgi:bifunctional ADP-heptose synthase (sugar kinase/adenylyltransferase)